VCRGRAGQSVRPRLILQAHIASLAVALHGRIERQPSSLFVEPQEIEPLFAAKFCAEHESARTGITGELLGPVRPRLRQATTGRRAAKQHSARQIARLCRERPTGHRPTHPDGMHASRCQEVANVVPWLRQLEVLRYACRINDTTACARTTPFRSWRPLGSSREDSRERHELGAVVKSYSG
jgi:hypothetical protein